MRRGNLTIEESDFKIQFVSLTTETRRTRRYTEGNYTCVGLNRIEVAAGVQGANCVRRARAAKPQGYVRVGGLSKKSVFVRWLMV